MKNDNGFTLVEVLVSVLLLSVGMFALAGMQISAIKGNMQGGDVSIAANLLTSRINELKSYSYYQDLSNGNIQLPPALAIGNTTSEPMNDQGLTKQEYETLFGADASLKEAYRYRIVTRITRPGDAPEDAPGDYRWAEVTVVWDDYSTPDDPVNTFSMRVPIMMDLWGED